MMKTIAYIFGAALLLFVLNVFYSYRKLQAVTNTHLQYHDFEKFPGYFEPILKKLEDQNLRFTSFTKYKNGEEVARFQSKKSQISILKIPNFKLENIRLQKSEVDINSISGIFADPLNFRIAKAFYSIDGFSKHHNQSNLLIQYNGKFTKENERFNKYYRFDSLKSITFTITDSKILDISFSKLNTLDLFFDHSPDGLFIGFIGN